MRENWLTMRNRDVLRGRGIQPHAASRLGSWRNSHVTRGVGVISGVVYSTHHVGVIKRWGVRVDWPAGQICQNKATELTFVSNTLRALSNTSEQTLTHVQKGNELTWVELAMLCVLDSCSTNWATRTAQPAGPNRENKLTYMQRLGVRHSMVA